MTAYKVLCHFLELPYGTIFTLIHQFPYQMGTLALFSLIGLPGGELLVPGRYFSDPTDGSEWIEFPGLRFDIPSDVKVDVVGLVAPPNSDHCLN